MGAPAGTQPWSSSLQLYCSTGCTAEIPLCLPQHAAGAGASEAQAVGKEQERSEKSKSEGEGLFRSRLEQSSHIFRLLGFEVEALLLFFTLSLFLNTAFYPWFSAIAFCCRVPRRISVEERT